MKKIIGLALLMTVMTAGSITAYAAPDVTVCPVYGLCTQHEDCRYADCPGRVVCDAEDCPVHCSADQSNCRRNGGSGHHSNSGSHHGGHGHGRRSY